MKARLLRVVPVLILLSSLATVRAEAPSTQPVAPTTQPTKTVRLLTIGNSFANNSTKFLREIARAEGKQVILGQANVGGCSLEKHWRGVEAFEADPTDPKGLMYQPGKDSKKLSLRQMLERDQWDVVTIQQASPLSADAATYEPYARNLVAYVRKHAPQAEVVIHQTWAYRKDHPRFKDPQREASPDQMHEAVRAAYHALADELDLRLIPVGDAMYLANHDPKWVFEPDTTFDYLQATYPTVPASEKRSLQLGWRWVTGKDGKRQLRLDAFHASARGEYLGGCVFYEALFGESAVGNTFVPEGMAPEDAASLQALAHRAMVDATPTP